MAFETVATATQTALHPELPDAASVTNQPDGAVYRCADGKGFRWHAAKAAHWTPMREKSATTPAAPPAPPAPAPAPAPQSRR